jgi:YidC/Oxa1 family membrane protein insertase
MEQGRLFLAIALSIVVFLLWEFVFVDRKAIQKPEEDLRKPTITEQETTKETPLIKESDTVIQDQRLLKKDDDTGTPELPRTITVNSPLYKVQISEKGAVFKSFLLKDYRERVENDAPFKELISKDLFGGTLRTSFADNRLPGIEDARFKSSVEDKTVDISGKSEEISFSWASPQGITVEKRFHFSPETYVIGLNILVKNGSNQTFKDSLVLSLASTTPEKTRTYGFEGPSALINNKLEQIKLKKIKEKSEYTGKIGWIAIEDRYFMSGIISKNTLEARMRLVLNPDNILKNQLIQPPSVVQAGTQHIYQYSLFWGPKSMKLLSKLDGDLAKAIYFGWFDIIAKPCLWFMNFIYGFIPNYGVAIIILTIFTKVLLWPLGSKSYKSMNEMKKVQPLMAEIREKYKGDKKKMNEEIMGLYKIYKINPMGGCLPMIVQIPVFFALYRMLYEAIELRHAPFFLWIDDLSAPDRLFRFDFSIPFMQPPYGIPVLTLVMGATMLLQQKMSPPPGDPAQAKMMMFMPIIFTFIFINFSSGLVLYWLVNNILSIGQQYYISKKKT